MALGDCFFLLHKANEFISATNVEKQVVKRKQQNVLFCLDGVNWSHIIAGNVTRLSSCQGACFPPISFPGEKKKKRKGSEYVNWFRVLQSQARCSGSTWLPPSHSTTWLFQTPTQLSMRVQCVPSTLAGRGSSFVSHLSLYLWIQNVGPSVRGHWWGRGHLAWCVLSYFSRVRLFATLWTVAHQASRSMGLSRQECWSGLPFPTPGDLSEAGIEPLWLMSLALAGRFFFFATSTAQEVPVAW